MSIQVDDKMPAGSFGVMTGDGPDSVSTDELFSGKKVVLFAVTGAFTPTCSAKHLPGYVEKADQLRDKVDEIWCLSVNDAFVMGAWGREHWATGKVRMIADCNGEITRALGLEMDASAFGLGKRSQRYAMVVEDGKVTHLAVEPGAGISVSAAEAILDVL